MKANEIIGMFEKAKFKARHGDVVIVKTAASKLPKKGINNGGIVAHGEATGHAHRVKKATGKLSKVKVEKIDQQLDQMIIRALDKTHIEHEEHKDGPLAKGTYITGIQKQFSPEGWNRVED